MKGSAKNNLMIGLTFVSILFIGFITVMNYPNPGKKLSGTNYYTSDETTTIGTREGSSYDALTTTGRVECPGLDNREPSGTLVRTTGATTRSNYYSISYLPYTMECAGIGVDSITRSTLTTYVKNKGTEPLTVSEMFDGGTTTVEGSYTEIVAPFSYAFNCTNVVTKTSENVITLTNRAGNCKMIISNPANWFCAGTIGTKTKYSNIAEPCVWSEHGNHHMTRIGEGYDITGGSAGDLIAYGDSSTTIEFICYKDGSWKNLDLQTMIKTERK